MRIMLIGGTGMTGPFIVKNLIASGHDVWLLHRTHSESPLLRGATQIQGDKADLPSLRERIASLELDVIVQMIAFTEADAAVFVNVVVGVVPRAVIISSIDVYRAYGRLHRTEPGPPDPTPLNEDSPLRAALSIHGEAYDKVAVERAVRSVSELPCTILRYPAVYGPGDALHRLHAWVRRMDDGRTFILLGRNQAGWRFSHGYVENVAVAAALAITKREAAGRVYNVGELDTPPWAEWARRIGAAAGWNGNVKVIPGERLPSHLAENLDFRQDWIVDTSRIRLELGYAETVSMKEGLDRTLAWERGHKMLHDSRESDYAAEDAALAALAS